MYSSGCRIGALTGEGCFKSRDMEMKVVIDKNDQRRISVFMKNFKTCEPHLACVIPKRKSLSATTFMFWLLYECSWLTPRT